MADEPDNLVLVMLREMRTDISSIRKTVEEHTTRFDRLEKRIADGAKVSRYALGQAQETHLQQVEQEERMDELFDKLEKLLSERPS